jgi:hypothetical protein
MRELRGVIIEESETGSPGTADAMPVDAARDVLRACIKQLMHDAIRFHEAAAEEEIQSGEAHE